MYPFVKPQLITGLGLSLDKYRSLLSVVIIQHRLFNLVVAKIAHNLVEIQ